MKIGDKVFVINPEGLYNKPRWIETTISSFDSNGKDFFTADAVTFILSTGCCGEYDSSSNAFALSAEGQTWWRADATKPSPERASDLALAWYWD